MKMEQYDVDALHSQLKSFSEQLLAEKRVNDRLRSELDVYVSKERLASANLEKLKTTMQLDMIEKEQLKAQNELLSLELAECRKIINAKQEKTDEKEVNASYQILRRAESQASHVSDGNRSGKSSASSSRRNSNSFINAGITRDDTERMSNLEQQVISLTREKKQLMTHLHWLTRQRNDPSLPEEDCSQLDAKVFRMSLEEGSNTTIQAQSSNASSILCSGPSLVRSKRFECVSRNESIDDGACLGKKSAQENNHGEGEHKDVENTKVPKGKHTSPAAIINRLRSLKEAMLAVKMTATKSNSLCDTIFQLSFQNLRHPNEPRSYSNWSSYDEESALSLKFLGNTSQIPTWLQESKFGYRSLETYPQKSRSPVDDFELEFDGWARKKSSTSSPELFPAKEKVFDNYFPRLSKASLSRSQRESMLFTRSLSDQQTKSLRAYHGPPFSIDKREMPVFSTLTSAAESPTDGPVKPLSFSSLGFVATPEQAATDIENNQSLSTSSTVTSDVLFSENLIS